MYYAYTKMKPNFFIIFLSCSAGWRYTPPRHPLRDEKGLH